MKRTLLFALSFLSIAAMATTTQDLEKRAEEIISRMTLEEKFSQLMNATPGIPRLDIKPYDYWNEGLHGVGRTGRATVFPEPIGLGATFDPQLVENIGVAVSTEGRAKYNIAQKQGNYSRYSGLTYWSPNINIFRDPRWGRGMETYGEDPLLTGTLGLAYVYGLQGHDPVYLRTSACAKHYAVHSGPEETRHEADIHPTLRDLNETYLPAFRMLVEGGVESVMAAYNSVYGLPCSASDMLLHDILRDRWDFRGHIVSDCGAVDDIYQGHALVKTPAEACSAAIKAGLNLECGSTFMAMKEAVDKGMVTEKEIDEALRPAIMTRLKLGIIYPDPECPYNDFGEEVICCEKHSQLARQAATESMVLLKNDGVLPLDKNMHRLYLTGEGATEVYNLMGNYYGLSPRYTCYLQGIMNKVSNGTSVDFRPGCMLITPELNNMNWAVGDAQGCEYTIVFLGNNGNLEGEEGEAIASDARGDRNHLRLPEAQLNYLRRIREGKKKNLIVILTGGSPIDMREICDLADAVVMCWYAGQEGGLALGDLLFGDANFSGRLPITFPADVKRLPAFDDYTMQGRTYKYMTDNVFFPFGFGMHYGYVEYKSAALVGKAQLGKDITATVTLRNNSPMAVDEVLQTYMSAPGAGKDAPLSTLVAFSRVHMEAGEEKTVEVVIPAERMKTINEQGVGILRKGQYTFSFSAAAPGQRTDEMGLEHVNINIKLK